MMLLSTVSILPSQVLASPSHTLLDQPLSSHQFLNERCVIRPQASVKAGVLYEAYKTWCEENQFGRGMNATLFGTEISRRFQKKRGNAGMLYQGVGLLTAHESSVGFVYPPAPAENDDERSSEADSQASEKEGSVGCVGFHQVFSPTAFESHPIG